VCDIVRKRKYELPSSNQSKEEEFEDTKGVIRIHKSKKNTMPKRKRTIKDLQNIHIKLRTPQKTGGELRCSGRVDSYQRMVES
jgi:hypothetical protein